MNRLHINDILAIILLPVGAITLMMFASLYQTCQRPITDTVRVSGEAISKGGKPNNAPSHCLVYGQYCLGEFLPGPPSCC
jgi:hypothetical protein